MFAFLLVLAYRAYQDARRRRHRQHARRRAPGRAAAAAGLLSDGGARPRPADLRRRHRDRAVALCRLAGRRAGCCSMLAGVAAARAATMCALHAAIAVAWSRRAASASGSAPARSSDGPAVDDHGQLAAALRHRFTADVLGAASRWPRPGRRWSSRSISLRDIAGSGAARRLLSLFLLLLLAGVSGAFLTGDLFNLYVWFEVMLIASFGLMVLGGSAAQLDGAVKYGFLNFLATTLFLDRARAALRPPRHAQHGRHRREARGRRRAMPR